MPTCEGRAGGPGISLPCPDGRRDGSVRNRQGDLMLCDACCEARFPTPVQSNKAVKASNKPEAPQALPAFEVNEVLSYIIYSYCKGALNVLKSAVGTLYSGDDLASAKMKLYGYAVMLNAQGLKRPITRAGINRNKSELEDICAILQLLDEQKILSKLPKFHVADLDLIPSVRVNDLDIVVLAKRIDKIEHDLMVFESLEQQMGKTLNTKLHHWKHLEKSYLPLTHGSEC